MSDLFGFCPSWPAGLKAAWTRWDKQRCRVRYLEHCFDDPAAFPDFEKLYSELTAAREIMWGAALDFMSLQLHQPTIFDCDSGNRERPATAAHDKKKV